MFTHGVWSTESLVTVGTLVLLVTFVAVLVTRAVVVTTERLHAVMAGVALVTLDAVILVR